MPFDIVFPLPHHACDPAGSDAVAQASPPAGTALIAAQQSGLMTLDQMPGEILVRIAGYLRPNDALALSGVCDAIFQTLRRDILNPLRLGEQIRWINGLAGIHTALAGIAAAPEDQRLPLLRQLQRTAQALHPWLREPAVKLLTPHLEAAAPPWWNSVYGATDPRRPQIGQPGSHADLLDAVLSMPPDARARALRSWFDDPGSELVPAPPVDEWPRIVSVLRPADRAMLLPRMARAIPEDRFDQANAMVLGAVREAIGPDGTLPAHHADALEHLAMRLVWGRQYWDATQMGAVWDEIFSLAQRLPVESQAGPLSKLTWFGLAQVGPTSALNESGHSLRCRAFVEYVRKHLPPADVAEVLGELMEQSRDYCDDDALRPLRKTLLEAAQGLPDGPCAVLLACAIDGLRYDGETGALWQALLHASRDVSERDAAPLYAQLASVIGLMPDDIAEPCWDALAQRLEAATDPGATVPAWLSLAQLDLTRRSLERRAVLTRLGNRLPDDKRAALHEAMIADRHVTPAIWQAQMTAVAELPAAVRLKPARRLALLLFNYPGNGVFEPAAADAPADPGALVCARFPRSLLDALRKLSDLVTLLPLADRGALLLELTTILGQDVTAPSQESLHRLTFVLYDAVKLEPYQHHTINVVTSIARLAERHAGLAGARALLPPMFGAIRALPADARASAYLFLGSLLRRWGVDAFAHSRWIEGVASLPVEDAAVLHPRKRKEPPQ